VPRRRRTRLPRGAGTVYEKRPGEWVLAWRENGRRHYSKSLPSRDLAERLRAKMAHDRRLLGATLPLPSGAVPALATQGDLWLERRKKTHRSWRDDQSRWKKHVRPALGHLRPAEVDSAKLRALIEAKLDEGLDPATVGHIIRLVSTIYSDLLERPAETGITVNPVRSLTRATRRLYRSTHRPEDTPFLTPDQAGQLAKRLADPFRSMYLAGFYAMLRTGEVLGLHAEDIVPERSVIVMRRQVQDGRLGPLKDGETRTVPLQDALRPVLARATLRVGGRGPLWPTTRHRGGGRPGSPPQWMRPQTLHAALAEALAVEPPLPDVTWYEATRHSGASAWVRAGGDMTRLAAILGHSSTEVTRRYAHLRPDAWTDEDRSRLSVGSPMAPKRSPSAAPKRRKR
jgi:site-specific recombinase XerC